MTWHMHSVPNARGPEHSILACFMEGVCSVAAHCCKTIGIGAPICGVAGLCRLILEGGLPVACS